LLSLLLLPRAVAVTVAVVVAVVRDSDVMTESTLACVVVLSPQGSASRQVPADLVLRRPVVSVPSGYVPAFVRSFPYDLLTK
jgi:hypothetical protein